MLLHSIRTNIKRYLIWTVVLLSLCLFAAFFIAPDVERVLIQYLSEPARILCWISSLDTPKNNLRSKAIRETWGRRCDKLLVVKNGTQLKESASGVLTVPYESEKGARGLLRVLQTNGHLLKEYRAAYDWFLKADDDTYVLMDSLRHFLSSKNGPEEPVYYGHRYREYTKHGLMSGGAGYVMSNQALLQLMKRGFGGQLRECHGDNNQESEDVTLGKCLKASGVEAGDTRDSEGKETFLPVPPRLLLDGLNLESRQWYKELDFYSDSKQHLGTPECCSSRPITLHYIEPEAMRVIDWLLYDVKH